MTKLQSAQVVSVRKRLTWARFSAILAVSMLVVSLVAATARVAGHAETIVQFDIDAGELSEGVVVDRSGNIFVSLSPLGQLVKIAAGSDVAEPFGSISGLEEGDIGLVGLAIDAEDNVDGAVFSANPDVNGVASRKCCR